MQTEEKTFLLLNIFIKQLNLQQILKSHLYLSQEYIINCKSRLDYFSPKMSRQREFLEGVYKILLLKPGIDTKESQEGEDDENQQQPNIQEMLEAVFQNKESDKPDFFIRTKNSRTSIYLDRSIKIDIILSMVGRNMQELPDNQKSHPNNCNNQDT
jgi:hypothetical protein